MKEPVVHRNYTCGEGASSSSVSAWRVSKRGRVRPCHRCCRSMLRNFRTLKKVAVDLGPLNVLVGPNQAGKSNFLDLIEFVGDSARYDLAEALELRGGIDRVRFRGAFDSGAVAWR